MEKDIGRLNPLNDYLFLKLFGEKGDEEQLIALLNAVLKRTGRDAITEIDIIEEKKLTAKTLKKKNSVLDVFAKTPDSRYNIEIQLRNNDNMDKRSLFYWSKIYSQQLDVGQDYQKLPTVIAINILDFNYLETNTFHSSFHLREDSKKDYILTDSLEIHFLEMPKFRRMRNKDISNPLHRMLMYFDKKTPKTKIEEIINMDATLRKVENKMSQVRDNSDAMFLYRLRTETGYNWKTEMGNQFNKGREVERTHLIQQALKRGDSPNQIAYFLNIPVSQVLAAIQK
jgi:predicted transposase/invertase (TIGR01784 family)